RDFTTNYARTSDDAANPKLRPIRSRLSVPSAAQAVVKAAEQLPRWTLVTDDSQRSAGELHFVRITPLFRFRDDIHVHISATDEGSVIVAESQSRIGRGDLGQNPRNLVELLEKVRVEIE